MHHVGHLGGDVECFSIVTNRDAFRFRPSGNLTHDDLVGDADLLNRGSFFVGDVDLLAVTTELEQFRARSGWNVIHNLQICHVDHVDDVVISAGYQELLVVVGKLHVAGAAGCVDPLDDPIVLLGIDHRYVVRLLVADKDISRAFGVRLRR